MSTITHDETVTGDGTSIWTSDYYCDIVRIQVVSGNFGEYRDLTEPSRRIRIGWWGMLENFVSDPVYDDGYCMQEPQFLFSEFEKVALNPVLASGGFDGYRYFFDPGTTVHFVFILL